jgi:coatomer protein complex subunit alpha (xenin)
MSAFFHPRDDYIVSASLDQTVRIWDMSGLKKKSPQSDDKVSQINQDLFGSNEVMVKYILEGHDRGVNWAYFHPTLQMVCSGGDDKVVRMWRYNESRAWEMDTYRGHVSNVSCCMFHPKLDLLIANSEDRSIRVWDYNKNNLVYNYKRETDRFWVLGVHPTQNLIAAGHDNGLMIFKFERERPAFHSTKGFLFYIKDKFVKKYDLEKNSETTIGIIKKSSNKPIKSLVQSEGEILITSDNEGGDWELLKLSTKKEEMTEFCSLIKKNSGITAVISGRKLAYLDKNRNIQIDNPKTGQFKQVTPSSLSITTVETIFPATPGRILLKTDENIYLYDFEQNSIVSQIPCQGVKYVVWSEDGQKLALISKFNITIANNKLQQLCAIHEIIRIKSGAFDENGVLIYSTHNHLKYCLQTGDYGTIKTLENPIYLIRVKSNAVHYLDREQNVVLTYIDATEYRFKIALLDGNTRGVKQIMSKSKILGESIITYLSQKGHPEIALKFVKDEQVKFNLALECGNIKTATVLANKLKKPECWNQLAAEALAQGDLESVEKSYQRTLAYEKLSFLYLINGDTTNLDLMQKVAVMRKDPLSRFQNALLLGDVETRIEVLVDVGQLGLAYITAKTHGLEKKAAELELLLGENVPKDIPDGATLLLPPTPVYKTSTRGWPLLSKQEEVEFDDETTLETPTHEIEMPTENKWGESIVMDETGEEEHHTVVEEEGQVELGGGWGELLEVPVDQLGSLKPTGPDVSIGKSITESWTDSDYAVDHIAGGSFKTAMDIFTKTSGIINFEPLKSYFMNIYMGSSTVLSCHLDSLSFPLQKEGNPLIATPNFEELTNRLKNVAFKEMTDGKFADAGNTFVSILHSLLFLTTSNKKDLNEIKEMTKICVEYLQAIRLESNRKESKDVKRALELVAYFTHCKLNQAHLMLSLATAMSVHFKAQNFVSASGFAKRLKKISPPPQLAQQADFVLKNTEGKTNAHNLVYEEKNPFVICSNSLTPIYTGSDSINCCYCGATYLPKYKDSCCVVCNVAVVGRQVSGLNNLRRK